MVALSILMVGCQNDKNSSDKASTSSQSVLESIDINTYHETMPVPMEGWTAETLNKTIYINGKNVTFPFTIQDLGEGFEWDSETFSIFKTGKPSVIFMKYNEIDFALVSVYASNAEELNDGKIMGLILISNQTIDKIQSRLVILLMVSWDKEQMVSESRSTTFASVEKTSFLKPRLRISFQICSIGFISGVYGGKEKISIFGGILSPFDLCQAAPSATSKIKSFTYDSDNFSRNTFIHFVLQYGITRKKLSPV